MIGHPTKQERKLPNGQIVYGVWLQCFNAAEAEMVEAALVEFIKQLKQHIETVEEKN